MQDPERSECRWWREGSRVVSGHSGEGRKNVAQIVPHSKLKRGILNRCCGVEVPQPTFLTYLRTLTQYEALSESPASHRAGSPAATAADGARPAGLAVRPPRGSSRTLG